jgi:hypothetical protein
MIIFNGRKTKLYKKAELALKFAVDYVNEFEKTNGDSGFVWIKDTAGCILIYGESVDKIKEEIGGIK